MSWIDRLQPASFRGVAFFVKTDEAEFGRRQVTHTAALVDVPTLEDLGRAADVFQVEGYLVGEDYDLQMMELIKAIRDTPGPGRLVHPRYGEKSVGASGFRIRHDNTEGRICRFTVSFGEAGELSQPTESVDAVNVLADRSEMIQEVSEESFVDKFKTAGFPQYVRDAASSSATALGEYLAAPSAFLTGVYTQATDVFGVVSETADAISETVSGYQLQVSGFLGEISSLVSEPSDLANMFTSLIGGIRGTFGSGAGAILSGILSLFPHDESSTSGSSSGSSPSLPGETPTTPGNQIAATPSRAQVIQNQQAITQIIRQTAVAELAVVAVEKQYDTVQDAISSRDTVAEIIDIEAGQTTSDPVYQQLTQARAELVAGLPSSGQAQANLVSYTAPSTQPALVVAQTLYADAKRDSQIIKRNMVRHPGFVTGGSPLQVLSDA